MTQPTTGRLDLSIWRNDDVYEFPLRVIGPDLTGLSMRAQIRPSGDNPVFYANLATVTNGNAEGVRLASATLVDGRWVNDVRIRINKSTRQGLPYGGEIGSEWTGEWAFAISGQTRLVGSVHVPAHALDSDNAPLVRPMAYDVGTYASMGTLPAAGATLTIAADSVAELVIDGADLVAVLGQRAAVAATGAEIARTAADLAAASAVAAGRYFTTKAAGEAASAADQLFSTDDGAGNLIYYRRTSGGSVEIGRAMTPAALAAGDGAGRVGFAQPDGVARTMLVKGRERRSLADMPGTTTEQIAAWQAKLQAGGLVHAPAAVIALPAPVVINQDRFVLEGEAPNASLFSFTGTGSAVKFDKAGSGGLYQAGITRVGFYSPNTSAKAAVHVVNSGNVEVSHIGIAGGAWLGADAIGVLLEGREFADVHHQAVACAQPFVARRNATHPTLSADHAWVRQNLWQGTSADRPVMLFEDGVVLSATTVSENAIVGGSAGLVARNTTQTGASVNFRVSDNRHEQCLNSAGYSFDLNYAGTGLQQLTFDNNRADNVGCNGVRMRGVQRALLTTSAMQQGGGKTAIDDELPIGGSRTILECLGQVGGTKTIAKAHKVLGTRSAATGDPIGPLEHWQYFSAPGDPGAEGGVYDYTALPTLDLGGIVTAAFAFTFPVGSRVLFVPLCTPAGMTVDTDLVARAQNGRLDVTFQKDGSIVVRSATGVFAAGAVGGKIYPVARGLSSNSLAAATHIRVEVRQ